MSDQNRTPVSRRRALKTGSLAALGAGLLASARPVEATPGGVVPATITPVLDTASVAAESRQQGERVEQTLRTLIEAENAIRATLRPEQVKLFDQYEAALSTHHLESVELYGIELRRHLPGLQPALLLLWDHVREGWSTSTCCEPETDA